MAVSKIHVTVPLDVTETFRRLSDHNNLFNIVDQVTTSKLIKPSSLSSDINGLGAIREITFKGDLLTEEVVAWYPPDISPRTSLVANFDAGYDYKVIAGKRTIADHLGIIRIVSAGKLHSTINWDIQLKVPVWATGEIAAKFVCRKMEKEITESLKNNII
jgi:hypothetical protein